MLALAASVTQCVPSRPPLNKPDDYVASSSAVDIQRWTIFVPPPVLPTAVPAAPVPAVPAAPLPAALVLGATVLVVTTVLSFAPVVSGVVVCAAPLAGPTGPVRTTLMEAAIVPAHQISLKSALFKSPASPSDSLSGYAIQ